jgi:SAM-dependent methyltransferase
VSIVRFRRSAGKARAPDGGVVVADAGALPFDDGAFDLVTAFMSLMDVEDMPGAVREVARVLEAGGRFCFSIAHPINTAGRFDERLADAPFRVADYFTERRVDETLERDGIRIRFAAVHRPLEAYSRALEAAGFVIEALREFPLPPEAWRDGSSARWQRVPLFLHVRAVKP